MAAYLCFGYFCAGVYFLHHVASKLTVYGKILTFFFFPFHYALIGICGIFVQKPSDRVQGTIVETVGALFLVVSLLLLFIGIGT